MRPYLTVLLALAAVPCATNGLSQEVGSTGHPEFNLEIIAKKACPSEPLTGTGRHVIFLQADMSSQPAGKTRAEINPVNEIYLAEGPFQVLDGNACDGNGARFQLPADPYTCLTGETACEDPTLQKYDVLARLVGKPGMAMKIGTCAFSAGADGMLGTPDDVATCSAENYVEVRKAGRASFTDVTKALTTVYADVNGNGMLDRVGLFDPRLADYIWTIDPEGQAHAQLVFVAVGK